MNAQLPAKLLYGLHPGFLVAREIKKQALSLEVLSPALGEELQLLQEIIEAKRPMQLRLADKFEQLFGWPSGLLMELQGHVTQPAQKKASSFLGKMRKALFWDTDIRLIDPDKHRNAIITRVLMRGTEDEKKLIWQYYGDEQVKKVLRLLMINN